MEWHGLLAQPRQTLPGSPWQAPVSPALLSPQSPALPPPQWDRSGDKGTLSTCLSQPNPCQPHHAEQGALLCHHRGMGQPCKGHPLSPCLLAHGGRSSVDTRGTGDWDPRVPESLVTLDTLDMGVPGGANNPAFVVTRVARDPMGAGGMREMPIAGSTPIPVCIHTWGAGVPGTPVPGMLKVLGGSGGF